MPHGYMFEKRGEVVVVMSNKRQYGCLGFMADVVLTVLTGGLWLIWIFVREMRRR